MKILIVITGLGVGGAERLVCGLADRFSEAGHNVLLAYLHGEAKFRPQHADIELVNLCFTKNLVGFFSGLWRLRRLIIQFRPDVVNSHLVHANILTRLLRLVTPVHRLINSAHNTNEEGKLRMLAYRMTDRLADISTNVSEEAVYAFEQQGALRHGRMRVIHNAIDIKKFSFSLVSRASIRTELGLRDTDTVLLAVGRLCKPKDYPNLLTALSYLKKKGIASTLIIVGDGPLRGELEAIANALGLDQDVYFLGVRHDVPELMSACDIFVLSSAWEGFSLVVAEAMACQRVVVATDCGGVGEVIDQVGILVPPKDAKSLATALEQAMALSAEEREDYGKSGRAKVESRYSLEAATTKWLDVYQGEGRG